MLEKAKQFLDERRTWKEYGKPLRSPERMEELFAICSDCEFFEPAKEGQGNCGVCGCQIRKTGTRMNKIAWATTNCPLDEPKWEKEPDLVRQDVTTRKEAATEHTVATEKLYETHKLQLERMQRDVDERNMAPKERQKLEKERAAATPPKPNPKPRKKGGCGSCGKGRAGGHFGSLPG